MIIDISSLVQRDLNDQEENPCQNRSQPNMDPRHGPRLAISQSEAMAQDHANSPPIPTWKHPSNSDPVGMALLGAGRVAHHG